MSLLEAQRSFYREAVPRQFNRTIEAQRLRADAAHDSGPGTAPATGTSPARLLEEMQAVRAGIRVEVETGNGRDVHALEIAKGEMRVVEELERAPFMILEHDLDQFESLRTQCGDSVLGFLGAMAGLGDEMKLTSQRVRSLRSLGGSLRFQVRGPQGFELRASFGIDPPEPSPRASISIEPEIFEALKSGALEAQNAFFEEKIQVDGELEFAIGIALAALSPD